MSAGISISLKITGPGDEVEIYGRMISTDELQAAQPEIDALKEKLSIGQASRSEQEHARKMFYGVKQTEAEVMAGEGLV